MEGMLIKNMKIIYTILLIFLLTGCVEKPMGGDIATSTSLEVDIKTPTEIEDEEEAYEIVNGKYKRIKKEKKDKNELWGYEYENPDGSIGWQAFEIQEREGAIYERSYGVGSESEKESHDWIKINDIASST